MKVRDLGVRVARSVAYPIHSKTRERRWGDVFSRVSFRLRFFLSFLCCDFVFSFSLFPVAWQQGIRRNL